ncbi:hypothetical protein ACQ4WX_37165 [Streptomyces lasalocidi]
MARSVPIDRRSEEYADLFGQAPVIFAALSGPRHLLEVANSAFFEAMGCDRGRVGESVGEVIPELVPQGVLDRLDEVYRTGVAYRARDGRLMLGEPGLSSGRGSSTSPTSPVGTGPAGSTGSW